MVIICAGTRDERLRSGWTIIRSITTQLFLWPKLFPLESKSFLIYMFLFPKLFPLESKSFLNYMFLLPKLFPLESKSFLIYMFLLLHYSFQRVRISLVNTRFSYQNCSFLREIYFLLKKLQSLLAKTVPFGRVSAWFLSKYTLLLLELFLFESNLFPTYKVIEFACLKLFLLGEYCKCMVP